MKVGAILVVLAAAFSPVAHAQDAAEFYRGRTVSLVVGFNPGGGADTYARLGWKVPSLPPFLPTDWKGTVGKPPYPKYGLEVMGPQQFPAPGDLTRDWAYGGKTYKA